MLQKPTGKVRYPKPSDKIKNILSLRKGVLTKITRQRCKIELSTETVLSDDALNPTGEPKEECVS